jgi:hypothetical protein
MQDVLEVHPNNARPQVCLKDEISFQLASEARGDAANRCDPTTSTSARVSALLIQRDIFAADDDTSRQLRQGCPQWRSCSRRWSTRVYQIALVFWTHEA